METRRGILGHSLDWHIKTMKIVGLWKPDFMSETFFKFYAFVMVFFVLLPAPLMVFVKIYIVEEKDLEKISDAVFVALELLIIPLKVATIFVNYSTFKGHIDYLDGPMFNSFKEDQIEIVKMGAKQCRQVHQFFFVTVVFACVSWSAVPLADVKNRRLPLDILLPYDIKEHLWRYIATYLYCVLAAYAGAFTDSVVDPLIPGFIIHATTQIKILKDSLRFLAERADKKASEDETLTEEAKGSLKSDIIYETIVQCVDHHNAIYNYVKEIEHTYAPIVFVQFATSVFVICITTLEMTMVHPGSFKFISVVIFITCMLSQIFLYCYYGNELFYETSTLPEAIFSGQWYEYDPRAKKALLILMECSKRPLMITAATLFDLSLDTFTTILKRAYSVFTVLRNIND